MYGAILGDMIGAPYEFGEGMKTKDFPLFSATSRFTDDTVMTVAVAEALLDTLDEDDATVQAAVIASMQRWGRCYPYAGYGGMFRQWLATDEPQPYGSFGNGSAMRVSAAGWLYESLEATRRMARLTAAVTHNHSEGMKGAEAVASAIFMARQGAHKVTIRRYVEEQFGYDLSAHCADIRSTYAFDATCQGSVPQAMIAFLEGVDFEDVIRNAVSLGGDSDTIACIAGSIAEAFFGVPEVLIDECRARLSEEMLAVVDAFEGLLRK